MWMIREATFFSVIMRPRGLAHAPPAAQFVGVDETGTKLMTESLPAK